MTVLLFLGLVLPAQSASQSVLRHTTLQDKSGVVRPGPIAIGQALPGLVHSVLFSVDSPAAFGPESALRVTFSQRGHPLAGKVLDAGDADFYTLFQPAAGPLEMSLELLSPLARQAKYHLQVNAWPGTPPLVRSTARNWQDATPFLLGSTLFGAQDDIPYLARPGTAESAAAQWFRCDFEETRPKLIYFEVDLMERDNLPVDVSVFRVVNGNPVPYNDGEDPVTLPHEVQALAGNKFTTRIFREKGPYYIRVAANHPEYKLRTRIYDPPPYDDPQKAVRAAVDYLMGAGDSWHANTPRRGGITSRVANVHQETSLCVACHPTHFSQRAQLYAARNGYPVVYRQQLQFLAERFYNNPRPFYGFEKEGAVWARVISAPANVLGRMSHLMTLFEDQISGQKREDFHQGIREYLKLYYQGREKLPADETNGNSPLVSTYEVAWYAWETTKDPAIARLIEQDEIKNMVDLCYQTLALAAIDGERHRDKIRRNADRILSLQRANGQWALRFEPEQPVAEFQTGHALWALQAAHVPADHPQVAKAIQVLLKRQQPFGGWMDPLQSYENFRTPFRESQMAVLALSSYFPGPDKGKGWNAPRTVSLNPDDLAELDQVWNAAPESVRSQLARATRSPETMIRQQAAEALGRLAEPASMPALIVLLGDPSKLVERTAAWAVRQLCRRGASTAPLVAALDSKDQRTRWGATRVFATHFAALARHPELAAALERRLDDPAPAIRMQAIQGLWQFWHWSPDQETRSGIEDALLRAMDADQHAWVRRNLREAIYNIADENIRYLYNNWVPLLAQEGDRQKAIRGRLAVEARLAEKFAKVLETGSNRQRKELLAGLTEFHLRRADVYDPKSDYTAPTLAYNRIGNDIEQIVFFGDSNNRLARAVDSLLRSTDPDMRRLAMAAALLTRDVRFAEVSRQAGPAGAERAKMISTLSKMEPVPAEVLQGMGLVAPAAAPAAKASAKPGRAHAKPDPAYFRGYVQPLLETRGKDGYACVHCHATHTLFDGSHNTALNVIDIEDPENSLILRKPTSTAETEGTLGAKTLSHGGGVRWEKNSPEYDTILNWIRGVKP